VNDLDRAVEEAQRALREAVEAARQAEFAERLRLNDDVVAAHEAILGAASGLRLAVLELHAPQRDDPGPPNCGVCFNSHGYEFQFPCPTYILGRDWSDT
jgi:hypothetical protein